MELNDTYRMAIQFNEMAKEKMAGKVTGFCVFNVNNDINHKEFSIDFEAYNYFVIRLNYENGRFGCGILFGDRMIALENSQKWWEETDFETFFFELQTDLEMRIPDKFLKLHNWL